MPFASATGQALNKSVRPERGEGCLLNEILCRTSLCAGNSDPQQAAISHRRAAQALLQRQALGAALQHADDPGVGDENVFAGWQLGDKGVHAGGEAGRRFAARRRIVQQIGGPGVEFGTGNVVPG